MPILWRVRPFVCLLLAASTAIGTAVPARACVCAAPPVPVQERAATPQPVANSCCQPTAKKRSCCSPTSDGVAKTSCCGDKVPAGSEQAPPASTPADAPGCHCLTCDCDTPSVPPSPAAPVPAAPDLDDHANVSPVPSVLMPGTPTVAARAARPTPAGPPTDLVISLSRWTC